ncbi:hypothetical protein SAMN05518854_117135 [Variovorax sp. YR266]|uniref:hypothetical protein n=1 Tax=Variovorax sp. YR266 TaxID=1884386 RepID=UPI00089C137F|nr:hypothetical protein [Variovorax sp. YR266]SDZ71405.1 hypothetical protein SAMN05518854_117135 [Variovorax sp. YR266]
MAITNAVLVAYDGAMEMAAEAPADLAKIVDNASSLYFGGRPRVSRAEEILLRDSLLAVHRMQGKSLREDMDSIWNDTKRTLSTEADALNITLPRKTMSSGQAGKHETRRFGEFAGAEKLIFGHHHKPRNTERAFEVGGFVGPVNSWLAIQSDGTVTRPA